MIRCCPHRGAPGLALTPSVAGGAHNQCALPEQRTRPRQHISRHPTSIISMLPDSCRDRPGQGVGGASGVEVDGETPSNKAFAGDRASAPNFRTEVPAIKESCCLSVRAAGQGAGPPPETRR